MGACSLVPNRSEVLPLDKPSCSEWLRPKRSDIPAGGVYTSPPQTLSRPCCDGSCLVLTSYFCERQIECMSERLGGTDDLEMVGLTHGQQLLLGPFYEPSSASVSFQAGFQAEPSPVLFLRIGDASMQRNTRSGCSVCLAGMLGSFAAALRGLRHSCRLAG